jgi:hypothetical protein
MALSFPWVKVFITVQFPSEIKCSEGSYVFMNQFDDLYFVGFLLRCIKLFTEHLKVFFKCLRYDWVDLLSPSPKWWYHGCHFLDILGSLTLPQGA